jgi:hypothetical protein
MLKVLAAVLWVGLAVFMWSWLDQVAQAVLVR